MRISLFAAVACFAFAGAADATPIPTAAVKSSTATLTAAPPIEPVCSGCGCRGGAGYRLPSGKCAPRRP